MKDKWITATVFLLTVLLIFIVTREFFLNFANAFPLLGGFIKFFFLASIGDVISIRLKQKAWKMPKMFLYKAFIWGFIGVVIVLIFGIFKGGVDSLMVNNVLPSASPTILRAFYISLFMNLTFAPTMMAFHRITDTYLDLKADGQNVSLSNTVEQINWKAFTNFVVLKTIPFFWIPAHTITFILPAEYQVIFAAVLGIFLGLLLGLFGGKK